VAEEQPENNLYDRQSPWEADSREGRGLEGGVGQVAQEYADEDCASEPEKHRIEQSQEERSL